MALGKLTIDLSAIRRNWNALNAMTGCETAAVVKANAYGLGAEKVVIALAAEGARSFFVAVTEEGVALRRILGQGPAIYVLSGHMVGDTELIEKADLVPVLNSIDQMLRHAEALPHTPFGIQLDTGMNRLGLEPTEWQAVRDIALALQPVLIMSHLACADHANDTMNMRQRDAFVALTQGLNIPRSLAATGGILLGTDFHFELTRPGIGLYGGLPYIDAHPVIAVDIPVIQIRDVATGESVGYGLTWTAERPSRIATVAAGYADGIFRSVGNGQAKLHADGRACPVVGRVSMDLIGVDVTDLDTMPEHLQIIGLHQSIDTLAGYAGSIGYEILTSLSGRYARKYVS